MSEAPEKLWFVLLVQDGSDIVTQNPRNETFYSEKDALAFAKESAREDKDGGEGAIYHVMRTTHTVCAKRRITVQTVAVK